MIHLPFMAKLGVTAAVAVEAAAVYEQAHINVPAWAFLGLVISAIGVPLTTSWIRSREKKADWRRQDEVAKRAEEAASKVVKVADLLVESNKTVASAAKAASGQIAEIHHMVDGQMTLAMQESLDAKVIALTLMQEVTELKRQDRDITPTAQTVATMTKLSQQIDDLTGKIQERKVLAAESKVTPTEGT